MSGRHEVEDIVCGDVRARYKAGNWMTYRRVRSKKDGEVSWEHTGSYYQTLESAVGAMYELAVSTHSSRVMDVFDAMREARAIKDELCEAVREAASGRE